MEAGRAAPGARVRGGEEAVKASVYLRSWPSVLPDRGDAPYRVEATICAGPVDVAVWMTIEQARAWARAMEAAADRAERRQHDCEVEGVEVGP